MSSRIYSLPSGFSIEVKSDGSIWISSSRSGIGAGFGMHDPNRGNAVMFSADRAESDAIVSILRAELVRLDHHGVGVEEVSTGR